MKTPSTNIFPAIRAKMGDWWYYTCSMTFSEIKEKVTRVNEIHERKELKTWIQRDITESRLEEIADYLLHQKQRFFNSIVLGIYDGDPEWFPVKVGSSITLKEEVLGTIAATSFGFIRLTGHESIFAIDGQHRVEGIKIALATAKGGALTDEQQTVIFVAHKPTAVGRERTRRLFSTLNKYAKPFSKGEIIALSEDDSFAMLTRKLVDEYPGLGSEFVPMLKTANIPRGDTVSFTSIITLYDCVRTVVLESRSRDKKRLEVGPPNKATVDQLYIIAHSFWDALSYTFKEIGHCFKSKPSDRVAGKYRSDDGGHLLFCPIGLLNAAKAVRIMIDRGQSMENAVRALKSTRMQLSKDPWLFTVWNPTNQTVITKNGALIKNIFLVNASEKPEPEDYDIKATYEKAIGEYKSQYKFD